jgi:hypothetical protein
MRGGTARLRISRPKFTAWLESLSPRHKFMKANNQMCPVGQYLKYEDGTWYLRIAPRGWCAEFIYEFDNKARAPTRAAALKILRNL